MAHYTLSMTPIKRSDGRSATAAAAYRAGSKMVDQRTGRTHDYTRKRGVEHVELLAPDGITLDTPEVLWNAAEAAEKRKDGRPAREILVALPAELDADQRTELAQAITRDLVDRYGVAAQLAIHAPDRGGDQRNHHCHILITTRRWNHDGPGAKDQLEMSDTQLKQAGLPKSADELTAMRERWANMQNAALKRANLSARVDHRSLTEQGIDRVPQIHVGNYGTQMIRQGIPEQSERAVFNLAIIKANNDIQDLRERLDAERAKQEWIEIAPVISTTPASEPLLETEPSLADQDELDMARESARVDTHERIENHLSRRHQLQIRAELRALYSIQARLDADRAERIAQIEAQEEADWQQWISRPDVCPATGRIITELAVDACIERESQYPENKPKPLRKGRIAPWPTENDPELEMLKRAAARQKADQAALKPSPTSKQGKSEKPPQASPQDVSEPKEVKPESSPQPPVFDAKKRALEIVCMETAGERHAAFLESFSWNQDDYDALDIALEPLIDASTGELTNEGRHLRVELLPSETLSPQREGRVQNEQDWEPPGYPGGPGF